MRATVAPAAVKAPDAGVIEDARARQRRQRRHTAAAAVGALLVAAAALGAVWDGGNAGTSPARAAAPTQPLTGPPLGESHLRLLAADTPPIVLDVDSGAMTSVSGVVPGPYTAVGKPQVVATLRAGGGALAIVDEGCRHISCLTAYFVSAGGTARRAASGTGMIGVAGGSGAWVLRRSGSGRCTLGPLPNASTTVGVPCGTLEGANRAGVLIASARGALLVDPANGHVRRLTVPAGVDLVLLPGTLALESNTVEQFSGGRGELTLVDLASGGRRRLAYPPMRRVTASDYFAFQQAAVESHGPLVALTFADPWYPPAQAAYIWILDTRTGRLTLLPGFPVSEGVKFSSAAWTDDDRLVVISLDPTENGGARTALGIWTPGEPTMPVRTIPTPKHGVGYWAFVPLAG